MMKSLRHLRNLLCLLGLSLSACAGIQVADSPVHIRLPASQDCAGIKIVSQERIRTPKAECDEKIKKAVFLFAEDYKVWKFTTLKNCHMQQCKQIEGAFDALFLSLDEALQKVDASKVIR